MIASAGFWAVHGFHLALVAIPATVMGLALQVEHRRAERQSRTEFARADELGCSLAAGPDEWRGIATASPVRQTSLPHVATLPFAVAASVGAALVHLVVMPEHFGESVIYGMFFLAAASVQIAWSWVVLKRPSRLLLAAGAVGSAMVIMLWLTTRTVGIPIGPDAKAIEPVSALDSLATALELVTVVAATATIRALPRRGVGGRHDPRSWPLPAQAVALGIMAAVAVVAFSAPVN